MLFFVFASTPFIFLMSVKISGISSIYLKNEFLNKNFYKQLVTDLNRNMEVSLPGLTANYAQTKIEKLIDDTDLWLKGKTQTSPVISFNDLSPASTSELKKLAQEIKNSKEADSPENQDMLEFLENGLTFPVGEKIVWLKNFYWWTQTGFVILTAGLILALAGINLLSDSVKEKFQWSSFAFLAALLWNIIPNAAIYFGQGAIRGIVADPTTELPEVGKLLFNILLNPVLENYIKVAIISLISLLVLVIGSTILTSVVGPKVSVKKK